MRDVPTALLSALLLIGGVVLSPVTAWGMTAQVEDQPTAEITSSEETEALQTSAGHSESGAAGEAHGSSDEHASDAHHDPHDLGHQNAAPGLEDPSEFKSDLAIWTFVVFLCLLGLLAKFAWGPIIAGLDKREQAIAGQIEEAKQTAQQAVEQLQRYEAQLAAAGEEARQILAQARRDAEESGQRIREQAQQDAERERGRAVEDIANAKNAALQEITERSVGLATVMAGRMLQRQLNPEDHSQLIREALEQLPSRN